MRFKLLNLISSFLMNNSSSFLLFSGENADSMSASFNILAIASNIISVIGELIYAVAKWGLYVVDVIFFYMKQLCGLEMDLTSLNSAVSEESDIVFNLLLSNSNQILDIVKGLIGIAIVLIIVFSIIAIIKNQLLSLQKDAPADIAGVFRTALKSFMMIIIVPFIAILSIVASNVLLKSLYNATNVFGANSLSSSVFASASTSANKYRRYAQDGKRIPISFDFTKQQEILDYYDKNPGNTTMDEYLISAENKIYTTYQMFSYNTFTDFNVLRVSEQESLYYETFDTNPTADETQKQYKRIRAYQPEYFVMADVIDYAVKSNNVLYFKTIEDVIKSIRNLGDTARFNNFASAFTIELLDGDTVKYSAATGTLTESSIDADDWNIIRFYSDYIGANEEGEPVERFQIEYKHLRGARDELDGAVFIMASEKILQPADPNAAGRPYYYPLTNGASDFGVSVFESEYIKKGQIVAAKGIFNADGYPTAIRISKNGQSVQFYRDNLVELSIGSSGDLLGVDSAEVDESGGIGGFFSAIAKFFKRLFNPASLVPNVSLDMSAVSQSYTKETSQENQLNDGGRLHVSYMFNKKSTDPTVKAYGLLLHNLFEPNKLNFMLLLIGTFLLIKTCFIAIFSLIKRAYDLFLIIIFYPSVCGLMPFDEGAGMKTWFQTFSSKLFMTYGLILGINFVLLLFPVIESIQFFTPSEVSTTLIIRRVGALFFYVLTPNQIAAMMNMFTAILFQLVAFTLLDSAPQMIGNIVGGENYKNENVLGDVMGFISSATVMIGKVIKQIAIPAKVLKFAVNKEFRDSKLDQAKKFLPMSALVGEAKDKANLAKKKKAQKDAERDLKDALDSNSSDKKEIEEKMKAFKNAQEGYTKALSDPTGNRKAEDARKRDEERSGVSRMDDDDVKGNGLSHQGMSDKQLEDMQKTSQDRMKYLDKKRKKGGLTEAEEAAYNQSKENLDASTAELDQRKKDKKDGKKEDKELAELDAKIASGAQLTPEEQKKYDGLKESKDARDGRAKAREEAQAQNKEQEKANKQGKKEYEKEQREKAEAREAFRHTGRKGEQKKILKGIDKKKADLEKQFNELGGAAGQKQLGQMSPEEITEMQNNPEKFGLSEDQVAILKKHQEHSNFQRELIGINDKEFKAKTANDVKKKKKKDEEIVASRNLIKRGIAGGRRSKAARNALGAKGAGELADIDAQIAALGNDTASFAQRKKLMAKKAELEARKESSQNWQGMNNKNTRVDLRRKKKERRQKKKQTYYRRKQAIAAGSTTEQEIQEWIKEYNKDERLKKRGRKKKDS